MSRSGGHEPCGGERVIDFAICLVIAAAVVGLLLLALWRAVPTRAPRPPRGTVAGSFSF